MRNSQSKLKSTKKKVLKRAKKIFATTALSQADFTQLALIARLDKVSSPPPKEVLELLTSSLSTAGRSVAKTLISKPTNTRAKEKSTPLKRKALAIKKWAGSLGEISK